jgi:SNF2 family DNA or RNA helicase
LQPEQDKLLQSRIQFHAHHVTMITTFMILTSIWCAERFGTLRIPRRLLEHRLLQGIFNEQKQQFNSISSLQKEILNAKRRKNFMEHVLRKLDSCDEICPICLDKTCTVVTKCGHTFCLDCINKHYNTYTTCPICKEVGGKSNVFRVVTNDENSKLNAIKTKIQSIEDPVIIFSQLKKVCKHLKILLSGLGKHVFLLTGNVSQRQCVLDDFRKNGGILLICVTDSFAGIRLPNVKHVIFSHPLLGTPSDVKSLEIQAIGRASQTSEYELEVTSFVSAETVEEEIWNSSHS